MTPMSTLAPAALAAARAARHARVVAELRRLVSRLPASAIDAGPDAVTDLGAWLAANGRALVEAIDAQADALCDARVQIELLTRATCPACAGEGAA